MPAVPAPRAGRAAAAPVGGRGDAEERVAEPTALADTGVSSGQWAGGGVGKLLVGGWVGRGRSGAGGWPVPRSLLVARLPLRQRARLGTVFCVLRRSVAPSAHSASALPCVAAPALPFPLRHPKGWRCAALRWAFFPRHPGRPLPAPPSPPRRPCCWSLRRSRARRRRCAGQTSSWWPEWRSWSLAGGWGRAPPRAKSSWTFRPRTSRCRWAVRQERARRTCGRLLERELGAVWCGWLWCQGGARP